MRCLINYTGVLTLVQRVDAFLKWQHVGILSTDWRDALIALRKLTRLFFLRVLRAYGCSMISFIQMAQLVCAATICSSTKRWSPYSLPFSSSPALPLLSGQTERVFFTTHTCFRANRALYRFCRLRLTTTTIFLLVGRC